MKWFLPFFAAVLLAFAGEPVVEAGGGDHRCGEKIEKTVAKMSRHGWLGIETAKDEATGGYAITRVVPDSPAAAAGFQPGDVLVALNGIRMGKENKPALKAAKESLTPGSQVTYTVYRSGAEKELRATLAEVPREVLARWVGEHVLDYHSEVAVAQAGD